MSDTENCFTRNVDVSESEQKIKELQIYGYTRVEGFLLPNAISRVKELVNKYYNLTKEISYSGRPTRDVDDKIVYNLQNKDKCFIDLLEDPFTMDVLKKFLNDQYYRFLPQDEANYILSYYNARSSGKPLDLHIDTYIPVPGERTWAMQVVYVLEDMNEENGCTVVVPGSHRSGQYTDRELSNLKPVHARAGDLVIWDSRIWHGATKNTSEKSRWALIATFTSWWIKQNMDMIRSLPENIYQQLTNRQKAMLGFCSIPPRDEYDSINTKSGYEALLPSVRDYYAGDV